MMPDHYQHLASDDEQETNDLHGSSYRLPGNAGARQEAMLPLT